MCKTASDNARNAASCVDIRRAYSGSRGGDRSQGLRLARRRPGFLCLAMVRGQVTSGSVQGLREAQEDRFTALRAPDRGWLLAVFDGHNGAGTAQAAAERVEEVF